MTDAARSMITSPNARYIQWRAELSAPAAESGQCNHRLPAAEYAAGGAKHQRRHAAAREAGSGLRSVERQLFDHRDGFG